VIGVCTPGREVDGSGAEAGARTDDCTDVARLLNPVEEQRDAAPARPGGDPRFIDHGEDALRMTGGRDPREHRVLDHPGALAGSGGTTCHLGVGDGLRQEDLPEGHSPSEQVIYETTTIDDDLAGATVTDPSTELLEIRAVSTELLHEPSSLLRRKTDVGGTRVSENTGVFQESLR